MTNEEAIEIIENLPIIRYERIKHQKSDLGAALEMAIEALELQIALEDGGEIMPPCR